MKREAELNEMFASMREEKPEVSVKKVHRWLGISSGVVLSIYLLSWIKRILFLKPVLMISSVIALGSLTFVTLFSTGKVAAEDRKQTLATQEQVVPAKAPAESNVQPKENEAKKTTSAKEEELPLTLPFNPLSEFHSQQETVLSPLAPRPQTSALAPKEMGDFHSVVVGSAFKVILKQGEKCSVEIQGSEEEKANVQLEIKDNQLRITTDCKGKKNCELPEKIVLTMKDLKKLNVSGACNLEMEGKFKASGEVDLLLSGAANVELDIDAPEIDCKVSGAVNLELEGSTPELDLKTSGAANIDASDMKAQKVRVGASGASHSEVYAANEIQIAASGACSVQYAGGGTLTEKSVSGASSVKKK